MRTKRQLLARITTGTVSVQAIYGTTMYRIAVSGDPDPKDGVWIALEDRTYIVDDYDAGYARVSGRVFRLTHLETDAIAKLVARTMRGRLKRSNFYSRMGRAHSK